LRQADEKSHFASPVALPQTIPNITFSRRSVLLVALWLVASTLASAVYLCTHFSICHNLTTLGIVLLVTGQKPPFLSWHEHSEKELEERIISCTSLSYADFGVELLSRISCEEILLTK
jgi:hypothetical protein